MSIISKLINIGMKDAARSKAIADTLSKTIKFVPKVPLQNSISGFELLFRGSGRQKKTIEKILNGNYSKEYVKYHPPFEKRVIKIKTDDIRKSANTLKQQNPEISNLGISYRTNPAIIGRLPNTEFPGAIMYHEKVIKPFLPNLPKSFDPVNGIKKYAMTPISKELPVGANGFANPLTHSIYIDKSSPAVLTSPIHEMSHLTDKYLTPEQWKPFENLINLYKVEGVSARPIELRATTNELRARLSPQILDPGTLQVIPSAVDKIPNITIGGFKMREIPSNYAQDYGAKFFGTKEQQPIADALKGIMKYSPVVIPVAAGTAAIINNDNVY